MMSSSFIIDVSEADFEYQVLAFSQEVPVVVDFWAEWCAPCRVLGPVLEKLAHEAEGEFRLAKLNVDQNPNLSNRYQVRSIPAVKAFKDGRIIAEFTGARPEPQVREFLRSFITSPSDLALEKGLSLLKEHQPVEAETALRQAMHSAANQPAVLLGLSRSLLYQGKYSECQKILHTFPASREFNQAEALQPLLNALIEFDQRIEEPASALDAAYWNAIRLARRGNYEAAMDGVLDILRQDKRYHDGLARKIMVGIFELLGAVDPITRQYRNELASVLF